jgi:hypothetical protein
MPSYNFTIKGVFHDIDPKLVEIASYNGEVTGFLMPDGRTVQLVMSLEVISSDGEKFDYVPKTEDMEKLGLCNLDYFSLTFSPTDDKESQ